MIINRWLQMFLYPLVLFLSILIPRDDELWVFGARGGEQFIGNSKYLFYYVNSNAEHVRTVWLSEDHDTVQKLRQKGYESYHRDSLQGVHVGLRAGVTVISHDNRDVNPWVSQTSLVVCLWHGFPLKRIRWDARLSRAPMYQRIIYWFNTRFDLLLLPSKCTAEPFSSGLKHPVERMRVTGYPRNDALISSDEGPPEPQDDDWMNEVRQTIENYQTLMYTPTYREYEMNPLDSLDWEQVDRKLQEIDSHLLVKPHPNQHITTVDECQRVTVLSDDTDVYPLLRSIDALITDYSSIYFDYLLVNKPILFYAPDLPVYKKSRGFYFDYDEVTPGIVTTSQAELLTAFDAVISDQYGEQRRKLQQRTMPHFEQSFSERAFDAICAEL